MSGGGNMKPQSVFSVVRLAKTNFMRKLRDEKNNPMSRCFIFSQRNQWVHIRSVCTRHWNDADHVTQLNSVGPHRLPAKARHLRNEDPAGADMSVSVWWLRLEVRLRLFILSSTLEPSLFSTSFVIFFFPGAKNSQKNVRPIVCTDETQPPRSDTFLFFIFFIFYRQTRKLSSILTPKIRKHAHMRHRYSSISQNNLRKSWDVVSDPFLVG